MYKRRDRAYELRKQNKSYNEINILLGIPKSTLSSWFKDSNWSLEIKRRLIKKSQKKAIKQLRLMALANREKWKKIHLSYRIRAREQFPQLFINPIFGAGLAIYWGEGDKKLKNCIVRISNIDYRMLKVFIIFLVTACNVKLEKIKFWMLLYPDLNEKKCKKYWSKMLNVSPRQFIKSQYIKGREKIKKVTNGVCSVQVYNRELKEKIIEWISLYSDKLQEAGIV